MKNFKVLVIIFISICLFSLNASQSTMIEPRALYSSVRARGVGDLVSIVIDEDKCKNCKMCMGLGCPAISVKEGKISI